MAGKRGNHPKSASCPASRAGVTLIELLIVMTILLAITSVAMRMMRPDKDSRRMREAARAINVYFGSARARAMETGRPCGVKLERVNNATGAAMILSQVETPPPYAGDSLDAKCTVKVLGLSTLTATASQLTLQVQLGQPIRKGMALPGSLIQFNNQGFWYITSKLDGSATIAPSELNNTCQQIEAYAVIPQGQVVPWTQQASIPVPFQIVRIPTKGLATPLQLPGGAVIDLTCSGDGPVSKMPPDAFAPKTDPNNPNAPDTSPVIIAFTANGAIDRVWCSNYVGSVVKPIYLLVGKRERVPPLTLQDGIYNWQSMENYWIAINPQNGLLTVAEVAAQDNLENSRYYARNASGKGGN